MSTFIFRNNTVEYLFGKGEYSFSGYEDISYIPNDVDIYCWFYQIPFKFDNQLLSTEVDSFIGKLILVAEKIVPTKPFYIFSLSNLFSIKYTDDDFLVLDAISSFNTQIRELSQKYGNIKIIDSDEFFQDYTKSELIDWKYYFISQISINPKLAVPFRKWYGKKIDEIQLKRKKCLVLDLDNTLWGGILGEDGVNGIKIGGDYPGKAFLYFQEALIQLSKNGVILAICSKNNESDVLELWEKNPFVVLNQKYISSYRINWQNKADNIKEIAEELNLGLDSFVFIDDNPTERELVKRMLPMVEVPNFPIQPYELPVFFTLLLEKYFKIYSLTAEDKQKTEQYKANFNRAKELSKFTDFSEYLMGLNIHIEIQPANEFNIQRIAQMTQKTNQFNLTTKRYTDADIKGLIDYGGKVYCINVSDKFGDNGITGAVIINLKGHLAEIDSLLLSCRILGKGIEKVFINKVLEILMALGITEVIAEYIPTAKNMMVSDFYEKIGFELVSEKDNNKTYKLRLMAANITTEPYYNIIVK